VAAIGYPTNGGKGGNGGGYINTSNYGLGGQQSVTYVSTNGCGGGGGRGIAVNPTIVPGIPYLDGSNNQIYYGGGGGGGQLNYDPSAGIIESYGGNGGGGNGCSGYANSKPYGVKGIPPVSGTANTGGGGGGGIINSGTTPPGFLGASGGSGVVIISILTQYIV
jgi:hypothetical protein